PGVDAFGGEFHGWESGGGADNSSLPRTHALANWSILPPPMRKNDWSGLACNLRAEVDADMIEACHGTVSLAMREYERVLQSTNPGK
ncbi:MAG: hypothetical protein MPL62_11260, partial [Alphaproteobacteria bacterium]|nr:hypothetical protein [Alphaproteobacteria bacterium]